jgi:outer membrane protein insertion porin family
MSRGFGAAWLAAALLALAHPAAADVSEYLGRRVASVVLESEGRRLTDPRLLEIVETPVGQPLTMVAVRDTVSHLFSLGRYEDVRVHASTLPNGVALVFDLVPLHPVTRITFTGLEHLHGVDEGRLRQLIAERFGTTPRAARAKDIAQLIEGDLRQLGYLRARATPATDVEHISEESTLRFAVSGGPRAQIGTVKVEGDPAMPIPQFLGDLKLSGGEPYQSEKLTARIEHYLERRRERGFFEARVTAAPTMVDEDRKVNLLLTVSQGPHVRVVFTGDPLPADRRDELAPIARENSVDEDLLEDATNRIEEFLRSEGYRDAAAPHTRQETDGELVITFAVNRGRQYRVVRVDITGNAAIPTATLQQTMRVRVGQPFSVAALDGDVASLETLYRREGFPAARVDASDDPVMPERRDQDVGVALTIAVTENARTVVNSVRIQGNSSIASEELANAIGLKPGSPFFVNQMAVDRDAIELQYANAGFQNATVDSKPNLSADGTSAEVVFTVHEGPRILVHHVLIVGNERTRTSTIERELQFKPGDPLGLAAISESQRRLAALGLFRRARITELGHGEETRRDVLVSVEEAPVTTIGYGGGVEAGQGTTVSEEGAAVASLEIAPRAFFEIGRRNLFGKNRSINLFTRASLRPQESAAPGGGSQQFGFIEYRLLGTYREPRVFGTAADAFLTGTLEQQHRTSFNFSRKALTAETARRLTPTVSVSGNYQIQKTRLFDELILPQDQLLVDRLFPQVLLSSFSGSVIRDTRSDQLDPSAGRYYSANAQLAARSIGSEVGFFKTYLTAQAFRTLPAAQRLVVAGSARLGMATGFPHEIILLDAEGQPIVGPNGQPQIETLLDLPASERFFAGGDTTVRGFALDRLGTPETIDANGIPIGGNGLVIFNAELRLTVHRGFGVVTFVDTGNVFARTSDIDLGRLRSSVGFGLRYRSPIGPIRVDLGFKVHREQTSPGNIEPLTAVHISLGQAF